MCGIAGIIGFQGPLANNGSEHQALKTMVGRMQKRGPDDQQTQLWENVGLGFARLSIVDVEGGRQPLENEDRQISVVVNGELYNHLDLRRELKSEHVFSTRSDCEILVHLFEERGIAAIEAINGMFGAAILDKRHKKLYLVRDRLGIKPLYYHIGKEGFYFASELKSLLAHPKVPKQIDWATAVSDYEFSIFAQPERSVTSNFREIEYLPGGSVLELDLVTKACTIRSYWNLQIARERGHAHDMSAQECIARYGELLEDSVRLRLMADVEYGLFLSGGIDSVSVAAIASQHAKFHTFTVLGQSTIGNGDAEHAHLCAKTFDLPNHQVQFDTRDWKLGSEQWKQILWDTETPLANAEQVYKHLLHGYAKRARPNLKVILLGQGSDEFNGGYLTPEYLATDVEDWERAADILRVRQDALCLSYTGTPANANLAPHSLQDAYGGVQSSLLSADFFAGQHGLKQYTSAWDIYTDGHRRNMQMYQLWHEDRTSSANSIESRVPFLDHRIVEHVMSIPRVHEKRLFWRKQILRDAMAKYLPVQLRERRKVGFFHGEDERFTQKMMYRMIVDDDARLLEEALAANERAGGPLRASLVRQSIQEMAGDPECRGLDGILALLNLALLDDLAKNPPAPTDLGITVDRVEIGDWQEWATSHAETMPQQAVSVQDDDVLGFGPDIIVARCETGDPEWIDQGACYVVQETTLRFVIEAELEHWTRFLLAIDGTRSIREIFDATQTNRGDVLKHLLEAIELGVVVKISKSR